MTCNRLISVPEVMDDPVFQKVSALLHIVTCQHMSNYYSSLPKHIMTFQSS